jgi:hypothetical protein
MLEPSAAIVIDCEKLGNPDSARTDRLPGGVPTLGALSFAHDARR